MTAGSTAGDLFARHQRDVHRYLARMTGSRDAADDLTQEVFLRVVRGLRNGGPIGHERGWVFAIAHNLVADAHRQRGRTLALSDRPEEPAGDASQALAAGLAQALGRLPDADREIFLLKETGGLSYEEIANTCGCTVESVRARLYRTRATLRGLLAIRF